MTEAKQFVVRPKTTSCERSKSEDKREMAPFVVDFKCHFLVNTFCLLSQQTETGLRLELCKSSVL